MADRNLVVSVVLAGRDRLSRVVRGAANQFNRLDNAVTRVAAGVAAFFGARALINLFSGAIGSARDFEAQLARVRAATGATEEEMEALGAAAREAGRTTRFTATQSAEALEILGRAGLSAAESVEVLPTVLDTAVAANTDLATAAGLVTDSLGAFNKRVGEAGRFADVLALGARLANTSITQLGRGLSYAGVQAQQAGYSVERTVAFLDALANAGIRGERAGTSLRNILSQLADPASKARQELSELGIETGNLTDVIQGLNDAGPAAEKAILAFGTEAGPALRVLLQEGVAGLDEYTSRLKDAEGASAEAAATINESLDGALKGLASAWDAVRRTLVRPLIGRITEEVKTLTGTLRGLVDGGALESLQKALVRAFDAGVKGVKRFVRESGGVAGVVRKIGQRAGDAVEAFSKIATAASIAARSVKASFGFLETVVGGIATTATGLLAGISKGAETAVEGLNSVGLASDGVVNGFRSASRVYGDLFSNSIETANRGLNRMGTALGVVSDKSDEAASSTRDAGEAAEEAAGKIPQLNRVITPEPIERLADAQSDLAGSTRDAADASEEASGTFSVVGPSAEDAADKTEQAAGAAEGAADAIKRTGDESERTAKTVNVVGQQSKSAGEAMQAAFGGARAAAGFLAGALAGAKNKLRGLSEATLALFESKRGFDAVTSAASRTSQRIQEINRALARQRSRVRGSAGGIVTYLRNLRRQQLETERAFLRQRRSVESLTERIEQGRITTQLLALDADNLSEKFNLLDEQDLAGLRSALRSAQSQVESLNQSATSTLRSLQEELARANDQFVQLAEQRTTRQREDIEGQLRTALQQALEASPARINLEEASLAELRAAYDEAGTNSEQLAETVRNLQGALATLDQVGDTRLREARQQERQSRERRPQQPASQSDAPTQRQEIQLTLPSGDRATFRTDDDGAESLIGALNRAGLRAQ